MAKRIHQKIERTPEEQARLKQVREQFQQQRPSPDELAASGEYNEPIPQGEYLFVRQVAVALRQAREAAGLSLADVEARSGIDKAALSRLETGQQINPTVNTLARYAHALGKKWAWTLTDPEEEEQGNASAEAMDARMSELEAIAESLLKVIQVSPKLLQVIMRELKLTG